MTTIARSAKKINPQKFSSSSSGETNYILLEGAGRMLPNERVALCQKHMIPLAASVNGVYSPSTGEARFQNLIRCDSMSCPFCAPFKSSYQRRELSVALAQAAKIGLYPVLATFTFSHGLGASLVALMGALYRSFDRICSGRFYQRLKAVYGLQAKIKATENTYGANGWHPHLHVIWFSDRRLSAEELLAFQNDLYEEWYRILDTQGYFASRAHGVDVRSADSDIADYVAKWGHEPLQPEWGVESEIARAPVKKSHRDGLTVFGLLRAYVGQTAELTRLMKILHCSDVEAKRRGGELYREHFLAFKGHVILVYSKGLKKRLDLDAALAAMPPVYEPPDDERIAVMIPSEGWREVLRLRLRQDLLDQLYKQDERQLWEWLAAHRIKAITPSLGWTL